MAALIGKKFNGKQLLGCVFPHEWQTSLLLCGTESVCVCVCVCVRLNAIKKRRQILRKRDGQALFYLPLVHLCKPVCAGARAHTHTHTQSGGSRCHSQLITSDRDDHPVCRAISCPSAERWRDDEGGGGCVCVCVCVCPVNTV